MAVSRVGSASAEATTLTIPAGHQAGDLLVVFAFNDASPTVPTLPSGWINITSGAGSTDAARLAYRVATSSSETSGTWTNAIELVCVVYRGADPGTIGANGTFTATNGSSNTLTYPQILIASLKNKAGGSWVAGFAGHSSTDTSLETPPAGMSLVISQAGASAEAVIHDTNAGVFTWPNTNVNVGGTLAQACIVTLEILPTRMSLTDYSFATVSSAGVMSVTEKIR